MSTPEKSSAHHSVFQIMLAAVWFGLAVGLLEGALLYGLQRSGLATWTMIRDGVDARILIVSPLFAFALFLCFGLLWSLVALVLRGRNVLPWAVGFLALAGFYDLLACTGRLNDLACTLLGLGLATQAALYFRRNSEGTLRFMRRSVPAMMAIVIVIGAATASRWTGPKQSSNQLLVAKPGSPASEKPNVVLVVLDTVRADHLGAYGYSRATSPNFDRFAREGVLFENAYSSSSWTLPSHASLFTNLYPFENGVDPWFLDEKFPTLAQALSDSEYATGGAVGNMYWCNYATGIARGFQHNADYFHNIPDAISRTLFGRKAMEAVLQLFGYYRNPAKKNADRVNREILAWLDSQPGPPQPFFAFLNYYDAHEPCFPPAPYDGRFASPDAINRRKPLDTHQALPDPVPADRLQADLDAYDSTIAYTDAQLGALWQELERRGLAQNTLLIITSDHGHSFGEGGVYGHRTSLRREQIHVPLVFYWPGHLPAGVRVAAPVSQIHVPATVMDLAGFVPKPGLAPKFGRTSLAAWWSDPPSFLSPIFAELSSPRAGAPGPAGRGDMKTMLIDRWQYIEWADGSSEVYDFIADPREERDASQTEAGRLATAILRHSLKEMVSRSPARVVKRPASSPE